VQVAHTCNPHYSGGKDQEDCGSKTAQENSLWEPHLQNNQSKMDWGCGSRAEHLLYKCKGLSSNPSPAKSKTKPCKLKPSEKLFYIDELGKKSCDKDKCEGGRTPWELQHCPHDSFSWRNSLHGSLAYLRKLRSCESLESASHVFQVKWTRMSTAPMSIITMYWTHPQCPSPAKWTNVVYLCSYNIHEWKTMHLREAEPYKHPRKHSSWRKKNPGFLSSIYLKSILFVESFRRYILPRDT
jgi:hypothetical protein